MNAILPGTPLMAQSLGGAFVVDMGIQLVGWALAATLKTEKFYDLFGSIAFASTAAMTFGASSRAPRQALVTGMVCAWTARLGAFLLRRVLRDGGDSRFDEVKTKPGMFLVYWTMQGIWVWVTALPCFLVNGLTHQSGLHWGDYVALAVWLAGMLTETTADLQKSAFKSDPANKGRFIDSGLWSLSRHPNYFGEIVAWFGVAGVALSANATPGVSVAAMCSPLFVTLLLTKVSGIPILEKSADERWGNEANYQEYKRNTPCLVPKLPGGAKRV
jgi:steroid 5-alpha reductase family enzyme